MNILPKKRWHVRTRENIVRVRRDEAAAAEEEQKKLQKIELAEKEARTAFLKARSRELYGSTPDEEPIVHNDNSKSEETPSSSTHVNLFYELDHKSDVSNKTNADHEREKKEEREKYEKQIGYLTYLGQDTNELTGNVSWYNRVRDRNTDNTEIGLKEKRREDPLDKMRKGVAAVKNSEEEDTLKKMRLHYLSILKTQESQGKKKKKNKKEKKRKKKRKRQDSPSDNEREKRESRPNADLSKLREERLRREKLERARAEAVLSRLRGDSEKSKKKKSPSPEIVQKYNSQFNPHLAKQNFNNVPF